MKNRTAFLTIIIVFALLLLAATPAFADDDPPGPKGPKGPKGPHGPQVSQGNAAQGKFTLIGVIPEDETVKETLIDSIAGLSFQVEVLSGNVVARDQIGETITIQLTTNTRIMMRSLGRIKYGTFPGFSGGQKLSISGYFVDDTWAATRVTAGASGLFKEKK